MFYKLITLKRDEWIRNPDRPVRYILTHIYRQGKMRDAQIEAIKPLRLLVRNICGDETVFVL